MTPGTKHDKGKIRFSLLPWDALMEVVRALEHGTIKYAVGNWKKVPKGRTRWFDAAMRHTLAWHQGEIRDPESGLHHLAHATTCLLFLVAKDLKRAKKKSQKG